MYWTQCIRVTKINKTWSFFIITQIRKLKPLYYVISKALFKTEDLYSTMPYVSCILIIICNKCIGVSTVWKGFPRLPMICHFLNVMGKRRRVSLCQNFSSCRHLSSAVLFQLRYSMNSLPQFQIWKVIFYLTEYWY